MVLAQMHLKNYLLLQMNSSHGQGLIERRPGLEGKHTDR
jgi:hypothetical protein